jgi:hypothetical protein
LFEVSARTCVLLRLHSSATLFNYTHPRPYTLDCQRPPLNCSHPSCGPAMDTDCPIVPVRKYVTPIEDLECEEGDLGSSKPEKEVTLSTFERLPRELRQMVYLILGYPVGRQVLIKSSIIPTNIGCSFVSLRYKMQLRDTVTQAKVQKISISHWDAKPLGPRGSKHTNMSCLYPAPPHRYSACKSEVSRLITTLTCNVIMCCRISFTAVGMF